MFAQAFAFLYFGGIMTEEEAKEELHHEIDYCLEILFGYLRNNRETALVRTKLEEALMWLKKSEEN